MKKKCECFTCKNKERPDLLKAYLQGCTESLSRYIYTLKNELGIKSGSVSEKSVEGMLACMEYDYGGDLQLLEELNTHRKIPGCFIKSEDIDFIRMECPFIAFYKEIEEYLILIKRKDLDTQNTYFATYGKGDIYPVEDKEMLKYMKGIIYMDSIFAALKYVPENNNGKKDN